MIICTLSFLSARDHPSILFVPLTLNLAKLSPKFSNLELSELHSRYSSKKFSPPNVHPKKDSDTKQATFLACFWKKVRYSIGYLSFRSIMPLKKGLGTKKAVILILSRVQRKVRVLNMLRFLPVVHQKKGLGTKRTTSYTTLSCIWRKVWILNNLSTRNHYALSASELKPRYQTSNLYFKFT